MTQDGTISESGVRTKLGPRSVTDTVERLTTLISNKGQRLFAVIDQAAAARQVGLELRDTKLVIFGSPVTGTPVMVAAPLAAVDLPLKVLVWDDAGQTKIPYNDPAWLAAWHHLSDELAAQLAGINPLTDALIAG